MEKEAQKIKLTADSFAVGAKNEKGVREHHLYRVIQIRKGKATVSDGTMEINAPEGCFTAPTDGFAEELVKLWNANASIKDVEFEGEETTNG